MNQVENELKKPKESFSTFFLNIALIILFTIISSFFLSKNFFDFKILIKTVKLIFQIIIKYQFVIVSVIAISIGYLIIANIKKIVAFIFSVLQAVIVLILSFFIITLLPLGIVYLLDIIFGKYSIVIILILMFVLFTFFVIYADLKVENDFSPLLILLSWMSTKIRFFEFAIPFFLFTFGIVGLHKILPILNKKQISFAKYERNLRINDVFNKKNNSHQNALNHYDSHDDNVSRSNKDEIISHFSSHGYQLTRQNTIYRTEGYASFPNQNQYILKHGFFSKRLVATLVNIPFAKMSNDCNLNHEKMGFAYKRAYEIKEENNAYFQKVYYELLEESHELTISSQNKNPIDALCNLHTGWCMWESYLISTASKSVASSYFGNTFRMKPRYNSKALTFPTNQYCGVTEDAVLLWISPDDYEIEQIK